MDVLRHLSEVIAEALALFFNRCMSEELFLVKLKIAKVLSIYQKGDKSDFNNHRTVAIVPILGKIFEVAINTRLLQFLKEFDILVNNQHEYRDARSTVTFMVEFLEEVTEAIDNKEDRMLVCCHLVRCSIVRIITSC